MNRQEFTPNENRLDQAHLASEAPMSTPIDAAKLRSGDEQQMLLGLDACRPGSRDLHSPELAEVAAYLQNNREARQAYHRLQQLDAELTVAFHDVAVPADLGQRILATLRANEASTGALQQSPVADVHTNHASAEPMAPVALASNPVGNQSRRRWIAGIAAVAASLLVVGALSGYLPFGASHVGDEPATMVEAWYSSLSETWQPVSAAPRRFAVPAGVAATPRGCQLLERDVWAYKLAAPGSRKALLIVAKLTIPGLPNLPPAKPQSSTGGRSLGMWQAKGLVYFLVVEGDDRFYRTFVKSTSSPLA